MPRRWIDRRWIDRRWIREPALHFAALGAALFLLHGALAPPEPADDGVTPIVVSDAFLEGLRERHRQRAGSDAEDEALIAEYARDEALHREALRLGLDRGDTIVRRRLIQKMELLLRAMAEPGPETLERDALAAYLAAHPERYRAPDRASFELVWFSRDRRPDAEADARQALARAELTPPEGDPFLLGSRFDDQTREQTRTRLGPALADAAFTAPVGRWSGPFTTTRGVFALHVERREPGALPALDEVRAAVSRDARREATEEATRRAVSALVERYGVERAP
ncbi:MAG: peptidylprolyl isomerase [Sandaracinaceae bacterium]